MRFSYLFKVISSFTRITLYNSLKFILDLSYFLRIILLLGIEGSAWQFSLNLVTG